MNVFYVLIRILLLLNFITCIGMEYIPNTDISRNTTELISANGYPFEEYEIQTSDGYFITIQRIPYGRKKKEFSKCERQVVILFHGLFTDSSSWVLNSPEESLGFILADHGSDVWLGNVRGNMYSTKHSKLNPDMEDFWQFSFAEIAEYDLPATIDFILNKTQQKQVVAIAMSQGATAILALLSQFPEYNKKIKLFIALGPVITLEHAIEQGSEIAPLFKILSGAMRWRGIYKIPPTDYFKQKLLEGICDTNFQSLCKTVYFQIFGYDPNLNQTKLPLYIYHLLSGTSINSLSHYIQMKESNKFRKYDYGMLENYFRYSQINPPEYNISRISAPVVLMWSINDKYSDPKDVKEMEKLLPNVVLSYCVPYEYFNHADFATSQDAHKHVYRKILDLICDA